MFRKAFISSIITRKKQCNKQTCQYYFHFFNHIKTIIYLNIFILLKLFVFSRIVWNSHYFNYPLGCNYFMCSFHFTLICTIVSEWGKRVVTPFLKFRLIFLGATLFGFSISLKELADSPVRIVA